MSYRVSSSSLSHWTQTTFGPCWWMFLYVSLEDSWDSSASASWARGNAHLSPGLTHFLSFHLKADSHKNTIIWSHFQPVLKSDFTNEKQEDKSPDAELNTNKLHKLFRPQLLFWRRTWIISHPSVSSKQYVAFFQLHSPEGFTWSAGGGRTTEAPCWGTQQAGSGKLPGSLSGSPSGGVRITAAAQQRTQVKVLKEKV